MGIGVNPTSRDLHAHSMPPSSHLPLLREMFPGKLFLDVKDIARCYNVSSGHIYNLSSADKLPFKVEKSKTMGVCVSILAMAKYLDSMLVDEGASTPLSAESAHRRKPGRPRKNGGLTLFSFQSSLAFELLTLEARAVMDEVVSKLSCGYPSLASAAEEDDRGAHQLALEMQVRALGSRMNALIQTLRPRFKEDRNPQLGSD